MLEPEELDRIPLPTDEATLFELLCLVRIARSIAPAPADVRWLSRDTDNSIQIGRLAIQYQQTLERERVEATCGDEPSLRQAVKLFQIRLPSRLDLAFDFFNTRSGFDGIIVEAKSGGRQFEDTISQLRTYRAARPRRTNARYLIWGIVENPVLPDLTLEQYKHLFVNADQNADTWVFSSAEAIATVVQAGFNDPAASMAIADSDAQ
jgi:hypothetical protein